MNTLIVCTSVSHGNTRKVADAMSEVLSARVVTPEQVDPAEVGGYDLVGFGSGIYNMSFHPRLVELVRALPVQRAGSAFVFSTSGFTEPPFRRYSRILTRRIEQRGLAVVDTFTCRGFDTYLPFKLVGGIRKGLPDADDLQAARAFAKGLPARVESAS